MPLRRFYSRRQPPPIWGILLLALVVVGIVAAANRGGVSVEHPFTQARSSPMSRGGLAGSAYIVDGDTIEIRGTRIRLWGIDAPESRQTCQGRSGEVYECGHDATAVLREIAAGQGVECSPRDRDRYGRVVAVCRTEAGEINAAMVGRGWAVDYRRYSGGAYAAEERQARAEGLGIWSGRFEMPERWRREHAR